MCLVCGGWGLGVAMQDFFLRCEGQRIIIDAVLSHPVPCCTPDLSVHFPLLFLFQNSTALLCAIQCWKAKHILEEVYLGSKNQIRTTAKHGYCESSPLLCL